MLFTRWNYPLPFSSQPPPSPLSFSPPGMKQQGCPPPLFWALLALIGIVSVIAIGLSIHSLVSSEPPSPSPSPSPPTNPYPVPSGLFCTFLPDDFLTTAPECAPDPPESYNETYCEMMRNVTDFACLRSACGQFIYPKNETNFTFVDVGPVGESESYGYSAVRLINDGEANDGGSVRMEDLVAKFMANNTPDSVDPIVDPPPGPIIFEDGPAAMTFGIEAYENGTSFETTALEYARQTLALTIGVYASLREALGPTMGPEAETALSSQLLVVTPQYCENEELQAIEWLNGTTNVSVDKIMYINAYFIGLNLEDNETTADGWVDSGCMYFIALDWFCDLFPSYYDPASIRDLDLVPSPWRDMTTITTAINREFRNCGEPLGCVSLLPA